MEVMNERAKLIFTNTIKQLKKLKQYHDIDEKLIQSYAVEMATYEEASENCNAQSECIPAPSGYLMINPWYTIRKQSLKSAMDIAKLFGFTPIVRKSLGANKEVETPMFDLLTNREKLG